MPDSLKAAGRKSARREDGTSAAGARVDYKEILTEADFAIFADRAPGGRNVHNWKQQDGVPVYAVFTNEQLAEMARRRVDSLAALGEIDGIGAARLDRYGTHALDRIAKAAEQVAAPVVRVLEA